MADHSSLNPAIDPSLLGITQDSAEVDISQNDEQSNRAHSASPLTPTTRNRNVTPMELIAQAHETERPPAPESTCPLPDSPTQNAWKTYINSPRTNSSREDAGPSVNSREDSNPQSGNTGGNEKGKGKASTPPAQMEEDLDIQVSDTEENVDVEVSDTEAEDIPIVLPNGERYPGDNPVTRGRMNYYFRENIDDFMERVRQNGNVDKICMMADWRTPRDKIGKYQLPHQLPYFTEITRGNNITYLYGIDPAIVVRYRGEEAVCILRDSRVCGYENEAWLLVEWVYTGPQLEHEIKRTKSLSAKRKKALVEELHALQLGNEDIATCKELILTNHLDILQQDTMIGPVVPRSRKYAHQFKWFFDMGLWKFSRTKKFSTYDCAFPRKFELHGESAISQPMSCEEYKSFFEETWKRFPQKWNGVSGNDLIARGPATAIYISPPVGRYMLKVRTAEKSADSNKKKLVSLKTELRLLEARIATLKRMKAQVDNTGGPSGGSSLEAGPPAQDGHSGSDAELVHNFLMDAVASPSRDDANK